MARDITAATKTASLAASGFSFVTAVDFDFESGHLRLHDGAGDLILFGETYQGIGSLGKVSVIEETAEIKAKVVEMAISGIEANKANVSIALNENVRGRTVFVYGVFLDSNGDVVSDPIVAFRGRMDNIQIRQGSELSLSVRVINALADWDRPRVSRYTDEEQRARFPADKGLAFVKQMVEREFTWGDNS